MFIKHLNQIFKSVVRLCLLASLVVMAFISSASPLSAQNQLFGNGFDIGANFSVTVIEIQADGRILIGGNFSELGGQTRERIARLNPDGSLDDNFHPVSGGGISSIAQQEDGKIVISGLFFSVEGQSREFIARLNLDGSLDESFNPGANCHASGMAVQADGKILMAGCFTTIGGQSRERIARLNTDGSLDESFNSGANSGINSLVLDKDGKIIVGGSFSTLGGQSRQFLGRLNPDGSVDETFNVSPNGSVFTLVIQEDNKILVGGSFTSIGGFQRHRIARLNPDGSLDESFNPNPGADRIVYSMVVQADGKIVVGGAFNELGGHIREKIARLNQDGTIDESFDPGIKGEDDPHFNVSAYTLALQEDGKIIVGGWFDTLAGEPRNNLGRLNPDGTLDQAETKEKMNVYLPLLLRNSP
jgi:uncharacterized delta-60 repeat protein